jgi:hypothetical protein
MNEGSGLYDSRLSAGLDVLVETGFARKHKDLLRHICAELKALFELEANWRERGSIIKVVLRRFSRQMN